MLFRSVTVFDAAHGPCYRCLQAGATIIYVTHQMEEVEQLCDRLILLKDGQAAAYGTLAEVKKQFGGASMDDIFVKVYGGEAKELGDE